MHSQDGVVIIRAGKFRGGICDQHLDEFLHIHAARANHFHSHSLRDVSSFHHLYVLVISHSGLLLAKFRPVAAIGLRYIHYRTDSFYLWNAVDKIKSGFAALEGIAPEYLNRARMPE